MDDIVIKIILISIIEEEGFELDAEDSLGYDWRKSSIEALENFCREWDLL